MNPRKNLSEKLQAIVARRLATDAASGVATAVESATRDSSRAGAETNIRSPRAYWRSLEELAHDEAFQELMKAEFPEQSDIWPEDLSRRSFLTLMGASLALAGLAGCSVKPAPASKIVPYVKSPRDIVPGKPLFFATTLPIAGTAVGVLVESHMGRPTKIEGNPDHPASRGATGPLQQAAILSLYDPDRSQAPTFRGRPRSWNDVHEAIRALRASQHKKAGDGLRVLSPPIISPTLDAQRARLLREFPQARWHLHTPVENTAGNRASEQAFGEVLGIRHDFTKADVVLALDADFLSCVPAGMQDVDDFMSRRRVHGAADSAFQATMNRLYVAETNVSVTGCKADHRLAVKPSEMPVLARAIASKLELIDKAFSVPEPMERWATIVARDLESHRGRSLVVVGGSQPEEVHLLGHAINDHLGNAGKTVLYSDPILNAHADSESSLKVLTKDIATGRVESLIILESNPVYTAPADLEFAEALRRVPLILHLGLHQDETARASHWHLPAAHALESWGDARTFDGTVSLLQPLIEPLYGGRTPVEVAEVLVTGHERSGESIVHDYWRDHRPAPMEQNSAGGSGEDSEESFRQFWEQSLHDGVIEGTGFPARTVSLATEWQAALNDSASERTVVNGERSVPEDQRPLELLFQTDPTTYDGEMANNGWLQELPKPITRVTWDNVAIMNSGTASRIGIDRERPVERGSHGGHPVEIIEIEVSGRSIRAPVWIVPGHADDAITITLGYGRTAAGRVGGDRKTTVGFNAYAVRTSQHPWSVPNVTVRRLGETMTIAATQTHHLMENRAPVRSATLAEYKDRPEAVTHHDMPPPSHDPTHGNLPAFYPPLVHRDAEHQWGMAIDLTTCVGCHACVVACQAENNVPVVGKEQVSFGREMHWLRVDLYRSGTEENPGDAWFQPVPCMHCEQAPCEYVCPVAATVHSADGLNDMIYNRCVGTRFCSNNCPYKVRRFNFLEYKEESAPRSLQYNPGVTVRSVGVMEKCTYCVQRIRSADIDARKENRSMVDHEVLTACQAVCPARAITFGDLNQASSEVVAWKKSPRNYALLEELNTHPRTTYLAGLRHPNPELGEG